MHVYYLQRNLQFFELYNLFTKPRKELCLIPSDTYILSDDWTSIQAGIHSTWVSMFVLLNSKKKKGGGGCEKIVTSII